MIVFKSKSLHQGEKSCISLTCVSRLYLLPVQPTKQIHWASGENRIGVLRCPYNGHASLPIRMMVDLYLCSCIPMTHRTQKFLNGGSTLCMRRESTVIGFSGKSRNLIRVVCPDLAFSYISRYWRRLWFQDWGHIHWRKATWSEWRWTVVSTLGVSYLQIFISEEKRDVNTRLKRLPSEEKRSNTRVCTFNNMVDLRIS